MRPRGSGVQAIAACIVAALIALAIAACGSEDEQSLTFTITDQGKQHKVSGPESAESGVTEITLKNESKAGNDLQLIRVDGNHSAQEVVDGFSEASNGQPFPAWFHAGGGIGGTGPGRSSTATQVLQPGTYYALSTEGRPDPKSLAVLEVSGDESDDELPEADVMVNAVEYSFNAKDLSSGEIEVDFENRGVQPHHLLVSRLIGDGTAADAERFFKTEKGKPPLQLKGSQATAVLEGGEGQTVTLDLKPGRYAFYCFISDRPGGPPHAFKGMIDEFEVE